MTSITPHAEEKYAVLIWYNSTAPNGRPFETLTRDGNPVAWEISHLQRRYSDLLSQAHFVFSAEDLHSWISPTRRATITKQRPLLVPLSLTRTYLGWTHFHFIDAEQL